MGLKEIIRHKLGVTDADGLPRTQGKGGIKAKTRLGQAVKAIVARRATKDAVREGKAEGRYKSYGIAKRRADADGATVKKEYEQEELNTVSSNKNKGTVNVSVSKKDEDGNQIDKTYKVKARLVSPYVSLERKKSNKVKSNKVKGNGLHKNKNKDACENQAKKETEHRKMNKDSRKKARRR